MQFIGLCHAVDMGKGDTPCLWRSPAIAQLIAMFFDIYRQVDYPWLNIKWPLETPYNPPSTPNPTAGKSVQTNHYIMT